MNWNLLLRFLKWIPLLAFATLLPPQFALASKPASKESPSRSCSWHFAQYLTSKQKKQMDPSDFNAIQELLKDVYKSPKEPLSPEAQEWFDQFQLHDIVAKVREEGLKAWNIARRQKAGKVAAASTGAAVVTGYLGSRYVVAANKVLNLEERLNQEYGLKLEGNTDSHLLFLEDMIQCNPVPKERKLPIPLQEQIRRFNKVPKVVEYLLFARKTGDNPHVYNRQGGGDPEDAVEEAYRMWLKYKLTFCSRWMAPSQARYSPYAILEFSKVLSLLPTDLRSGLRGLSGVVLTSPDFQDASIANMAQGTRALGVYKHGSQRIELYNEGILSDRSLWAFTHEMAHRLSMKMKIAESQEWLDLNWETALGSPTGVKEGVWFPTLYAQTSPEECFAEAVACYTVQEVCRDEMQKEHPKMHDFLHQLLHIDKKDVLRKGISAKNP